VTQNDGRSAAPDARYRLGILTDNALWYTQSDLLERELLKPGLLQTFGWKIIVVLARDWYRDQESCLQRLRDALADDVCSG
jgi:hypothetical protein